MFLCNETINIYPSFKRILLKRRNYLFVSSEVIKDVVLNEDYFYEYITK